MIYVYLEDGNCNDGSHLVWFEEFKSMKEAVDFVARKRKECCLAGDVLPRYIKGKEVKVE